MAFNKQQFNVLETLGFRGMYFEKSGRLIAFYEDDHREFELVCEHEPDRVRAWVIKNGAPRNITYAHRNGNSPQYYFRSVRQAAEMAISNRHY